MTDFLDQTRGAGLENELLQQRPAARDEFVMALAWRIEARPERSRRRRMGMVSAIAGVALVALGASGGGSYAYSYASRAATKIASAVNLDQSRQIQRPDSSSRAQYGPVPVPPYPPPKPSTPVTTPTPPSTTPTTPFTPPAKSGGKSPGSKGGTRGSGTSTVSGGPSKGSGLPFTGLSLLVPVLLGAGLIFLGAILRRRGRATPR